MISNKALLPDNFYAALQSCRRARRYKRSVFILIAFLFQAGIVSSNSELAD